MEKREVKDTYIKVRVTKEERARIAAWCKEHGMTMSELYRKSIERTMGNDYSS